MLLQNIIRGLLRESASADGAAAGGSDAGAQSAPQQHGGRDRPVQDRIRDFLFASDKRQPAEQSQGDESDDDAEVQGHARQEAAPAKKAEKPQQQAGQESEAESADDADDSDAITSISELAERTGLGLDRILNMQHTLKSGDKETKASIREMLRSYQTSELLNSKLQTHASEVAAWKAEQAQHKQTQQQQLQKLDAGLQVAQRALQGKFNQVNWDQLQQSDPAQFAQTLLGFQQEQAMLSQIADQLGQERRSQESQQAEQHKAWLAEQKQLLEAKLPEWSDEKARKTAIQEIVEVGGKVYGFSAEDIGKLSDHRDFLVLSDAIKWQKLQASKAATLNKVRQAPKLLRPGTAQSQESRRGEAFAEAKNRAHKSGNVRDVAKALRAAGIV